MKLVFDYPVRIPCFKIECIISIRKEIKLPKLSYFILRLLSDPWANHPIGFLLSEIGISKSMQMVFSDEVEKLIKDLSSIQLPKGYPNQYALKQETELIIKNMQLNCNSVDEWMQNYDSIRPKNRPKSSFELGFVITELFSWDDG